MFFNPTIVWIGAKLKRRVPPEVRYVFQIKTSGGKSLVKKAILGHIEVIFDEYTDFPFGLTVGREKHG